MGQESLVLGVGLQTHQAMTRSAAKSSVARLTERQREVLKGIASSETHPAIADRLGIGVKTVEDHRQEARKRLGIEPHDTAGLVRVAMRAGLID